MTNKPVIAVVGATGMVGGEILEIIQERKFPYKEIKALASAESAGEIYQHGEDLEVVVEELTENSFHDVDLALFAVGNELAEKFVPIAVESGAMVIDNSSFFRLEENVPLVIPEVNFDVVNKSHRIIANPNCSTMQLVPVLHALSAHAKIKRVVVSTYQAVSGAGKAAMDELLHQTASILNHQDFSADNFPAQIAFNCIPHIDVLLDNGKTKEEVKVERESRKILGESGLAITCTAVRVPVFNAHAESVNIEFESAITADQCRKILNETSGLTVTDFGSSDMNSSSYPLQTEISGLDDIFIGRIRADDSAPHALNLWIVADNLRKGAALNAVQIAERLQSANLI